VAQVPVLITVGVDEVKQLTKLVPLVVQTAVVAVVRTTVVLTAHAVQIVGDVGLHVLQPVTAIVVPVLKQAVQTPATGVA